MAENRFSNMNLYKDQPKDQPPTTKPQGATQPRRSGSSRRAPEPTPVDGKMQKLEDLRLAYQDIRGAGRGSDPTDPLDLAAPAKVEKTEEFREFFGDTPLPKKFARYNLGAHESDPTDASEVNTRNELKEYEGIVEDVKGVGGRVDPHKDSSLNLGYVPLTELARMDFADTSGGRDSLVNFVEGRGDSLTIDGLGRYIEAQEARKMQTGRLLDVRDPDREDEDSVDRQIAKRREEARIDKNIEMATDVRERLMKIRDLTAATPTAKPQDAQPTQKRGSTPAKPAKAPKPQKIRLNPGQSEKYEKLLFGHNSMGYGTKGSPITMDLLERQGISDPKEAYQIYKYFEQEQNKKLEVGPKIKAVIREIESS